jgi:hypothetical protein
MDDGSTVIGVMVSNLGMDFDHSDGRLVGLAQSQALRSDYHRILNEKDKAFGDFHAKMM